MYWNNHILKEKRNKKTPEQNGCLEIYQKLPLCGCTGYKTRPSDEALRYKHGGIMGKLGENAS